MTSYDFIIDSNTKDPLISGNFPSFRSKCLYNELIKRGFSVYLRKNEPIKLKSKYLIYSGYQYIAGVSWYKSPSYKTYLNCDIEYFFILQDFISHWKEKNQQQVWFTVKGGVMTHINKNNNICNKKIGFGLYDTYNCVNEKIITLDLPKTQMGCGNITDVIINGLNNSHDFIKNNNYKIIIASDDFTILDKRLKIDYEKFYYDIHDKWKTLLEKSSIYLALWESFGVCNLEAQMAGCYMIQPETLQLDTCATDYYQKYYLFKGTLEEKIIALESAIKKSIVFIKNNPDYSTKISNASKIKFNMDKYIDNILNYIKTFEK